MLETLLMRAFLLLYVRDYETDDYVHESDDYAHGTDDDGASFMYLAAKFSRAEHRSFTLLSSVCWNWHQTLIGWPESSTPGWLRHRLKKLIACENASCVDSTLLPSCFMFRKYNRCLSFVGLLFVLNSSL